MDTPSQTFLCQAEGLIQNSTASEELLTILRLAEEQAPEQASTFCHSAKLLFLHALFLQEGRFFLLALDKLKTAEEKDPLFFSTQPSWLHLWGRIYLQLGRLTQAVHFFESALEKFAQAEKVSPETPGLLYWDWGVTWKLLGEQSGELSDLHKALQYFQIADEKGGTPSPYFLLDWAGAIVAHARLKGDPHLLEKGIVLLQGIVTDTYSPKNEAAEAYEQAFVQLALTLKLGYDLTHRLEDFEKADAAFREAILALPARVDLWLSWGELFLTAGWLRKSPQLLETALEKLTFSKIDQCDPLRATALLGSSLATFGLFAENLKLIKQGEEKVETLLSKTLSPVLLGAMGYIQLMRGLFFTEPQQIMEAVSALEEAIAYDVHSILNWHALFEAYMAWGMQEQDPTLVRKGVYAIAHLSTTHPFSGHYLNEWGVALLRLKRLESETEKALECVEEAILRLKRAWDLTGDLESLYNLGCAYDLHGEITGDEESYEKAVALFTQLFEKRPREMPICWRLGLALAHLGEVTMHVETLEQAATLLESVVQVEKEEEGIWCDLGYVQLLLSELVADPVLPEKKENFRREAEKKLLRAAELGSGDACYHLACLYSLSGLQETSMHFLKKAELEGFLPPLEELAEDEWLDNIRHTPDFQEFILLREDDE